MNPWLLVLLLWFATVTARAEIRPFTFVHFSDTHIGNKGYDERLKQALADVDANFDDTAFIIVTGDVTEMGWPEEFTSFSEVVKGYKRPIYTCPGNHDVRWSESGKGNYKKFLGDRYRSFDYNGVRFILMDVTILLQHHAHFDAAQLERLEADLHSMPPDMPAIIGMHQPPLSQGHFFDNEMEFVRLIEQYNVPLVLTGHGHSFDRYTYNGTTYCMAGTTSDKGSPAHSYRVFRFTSDGVATARRLLDSKVTTPEHNFPARHYSHPRWILGMQVVRGMPGVLRFDMRPWGMDRWFPGTYELDHWTTGATTGLRNAHADLDTGAIPNGSHELLFTIADDNGTTHIDSRSFTTSEASAPRIMREFALPGGAIAMPCATAQGIYAGANDGKLRAFMPDEQSTEPLWQTDLHAEIISSPALTSDTVVVGSMDGNFYSLNQLDGTIRWTFKTGNGVQASPLVTTDTVFIGSGDSHMYAIDVATGNERWRFAAKKHIKHTPALTTDGRLIFGAWDNQLYCLNSATGALIWQVPASTLPGGHFSAATSNPVTTGSFVILCTHDWCVRSFGVLNGGQQWIYRPKFQEFGPCQSTAAFRGNVAYFGSINGHIVGHDMANGEKVFDFNVRPEKPDAFYDSSPLIVGDKLYIGSVGGYVYCIDIPSKTVEWRVAVQPGFVFANVVRWKDRLLVATTADTVYEIGPISF